MTTTKRPVGDATGPDAVAQIVSSETWVVDALLLSLTLSSPIHQASARPYLLLAIAQPSWQIVRAECVASLDDFFIFLRRAERDAGRRPSRLLLDHGLRRYLASWHEQSDVHIIHPEPIIGIGALVERQGARVIRRLEATWRNQYNSECATIQGLNLLLPNVIAANLSPSPSRRGVRGEAS